MRVAWWSNKKTSLKYGQVPLDKSRRYSISDFKKLAHAIWGCEYHIVWCLKYRFNILQGPLQKCVEETMAQLCERKKIELLEMNVQEDHVHLLISIPPKYAVSDVVGVLKDKSAIKVFGRL